MDFPVKRKGSSKRSVPSLQKRKKTLLSEKSFEAATKATYLRKDLWIEIIDYLDTKSYFWIIPQVNSFFYFLVKDCKNYRTSLKFMLKVSYSNTNNTNHYKIVKNSKSIDYILNCQLLNKLELKLERYEMITKKALDSSLSFAQYFIQMITLNTLKVLKIHVIRNFSIQVENLLVLMENLEVLKINFQEYFPSGFPFIQTKYIKNNENTSHHKKSLKKLSLRYYSLHVAHSNINDIFESLDKNVNLEKFSMKTLTKYSSKIEMTMFLKANNSLKCIKLPSDFFFNKTSADELCSFLIKSKILEELQISDSIMICSEQFIDAILINRSLKILALKHYVSNNNLRFEINTEDSCELLSALGQSLIEDFSMSVFLNNNSNFYDNQKHRYLALSLIKNKIEKFLESLNYFLLTSEKIRKISINLSEIPYKYVSSLAELIIKHVKLGKIEYFAGYNLKLIIENKLEILELGKKDKMCPENYGLLVILCEIFRKLLVNADKILRLIDHNYSKNVTDVQELMQSLSESKSLVLNQNNAVKGFGLFSSLHYFSIIVISTRVNGIKELDIRNIHLESYNVSFPEVLKEFKSLEKLKFNIKNSNHYEYNFPSIFIAVSTELVNVSHINCTLDSTYFVKLIDILSNLTTHENLRKFKLNKYRFLLNNCIPDNSLNNFISKSRLISLNLSDISLTYEHITQIVKGLEENQTITRLKIEKIKFEELQGVANIKKTTSAQRIEAFLMLSSALGLKNYYEKLSLFYSNGYIDEDLVTDEFSKQYLENINNILTKNQNLKEFNINMALPDKFLLNYSEIVLKTIKNNKQLKIVNCFDMEEIISDDKKAIVLAYEYYGKCNHWRIHSASLQMSKVNSEFHKCMPIVLSELIKNSQPFVLNNLIRRLFGSGANAKCKSINLTKLSQVWKKSCRIYKYNFIDSLTSLEELIILNTEITAIEIEVIEKNIAKLECLKTIKLKNVYYKNNDISSFLAAKNLNYLKIADGNLFTEDLIKFSERIKSSKLEKLTFKNISFANDTLIHTHFQQLVEAISCSSLRILKIYINYSHRLLDFLIRRLYTFKNLEYLGVSISENYSSFHWPIKKLVSLFQNLNNMLSKVKVHKYTWDIEKLQGKKDLKFIGCNLNPADLMVFAELCEERIVKYVNCINLSENMGIIDDNFSENIVKIIRNLDCDEVVMKKSGCEQKHIREIKSLLGNKKSSSVNFIIS
ncbi:hypothetical protein SteCoe_15617 [Stentor coeruleus]|uniref:Uncharacterized protein n=1 Tax=Stentor coeruleus TaxID=5963 RepID=A0A1R2C3A7_9CILI|nr:hypothetical protein SteCoe_15617 [Stentor coeruleus]